MNKFEKWLYILFDKTSGLKNLIISYNEKRMDLERIRKEKELIKLELDKIKGDQENSTNIVENCESIIEDFKKIKDLKQFKEVKKKKLLLDIDVLKEKVTRIKNSTEDIEEKKNKLLEMRHNDNNQNVEIDIIIENLTNKFEELKNLLNNEEITENKLLYCEKELLKLKDSVDIEKKFEKKVDENKYKEIGEKEKFTRSNKIFDSIWEGLKFEKILKEKRKVLERSTTIESSGFLYHEYLIWILSFIGLFILISVIKIFKPNVFPDEYFIYIFIFFPLFMLLLYIKPSFVKSFLEFSIIGGLIYFICQIMISFGNIILKLSNLYFIENNQETESIIFIIGVLLFIIFAIIYIPNLINVFKIEKIASIEMNINQIIRVFILILLFFIYQCSNKNNKDIDFKSTDFIVDTEIPNFEETKGKIFIDEEEIPIKIIDEKIIKSADENEFKEKVVVNIGNEKIKVMGCTKNDCKNANKGKIINLKNKNFILLNEKKYEEECEKNYNSFNLLKKCYESKWINPNKWINANKWIVEGNILKGEMFKIEDKYYTFDKNTISAPENINYILYPVKKLFISSIFFIILYLIFKGNKDYYINQKKEIEKKEELIKFLIGEEVKQYKKDKLEEEIKEIEEIFNFSMFKMFFTIPPLATIVFVIFNFIQEPEINFKINFNSAFAIMLLFVFISTIVLLIFIGFIVKKIIIEMMFLPRNEFFEFKEIIMEIAKNNGESPSNV
ncbi:hypothetical protein [Leptotrichia sp. oral taxon 221]|uniref:hypothetical protein n=1 Tax=Leptotrichia sp. oral taxon 221 TaxID=712362 RepID=UPI001B8C8D2E|nr:hypothetical protein [Leptotrichia sp. oral taxon 221]QUB97964.1 hypothetical protein J4863_04480 [Leptotrichia sp. oral taxon 221]